MLQEERAMRIKAIRNRIRQIKVSGSIRPMDKDKLSHIAQQYNRLKGAEGTPAKKVRITRKESSAGGETRSITGSINGSSCITLETWDYNGNLISDYYGYVSDYDGCFVCLGIDMGYISNY
ncbi:MAG: hypothetical protein J6X29_03560, partial [Clostridia bacterium]|nr:hypothetical protein [Clostridia bacterium]